MKVKITGHGFKPERAHSTDAGLDIRSPFNTIVRARESAIIKTGVHVQLPENTAGLLV